MSLDFMPSDLARVTSRLRDIDRRHMPNVSRLALNDMAFAVLRENKALMQREFDRPTPFTLNAFYVKKAALQNMEALVERKTMQRGRHYLETQQLGGPRPDTGVERLLKSRLRYEGLIQAVVPTKGLRRNRYGNVAAGTMQRILSGVQAQSDRAQNTTAASRRRAAYFVPSLESSLSPGVYERSGKRIKKVLAFSDSQPRYRERFPMEEHARDVAEDEAAPAFRRALARELSNI
jgi:hypothetical protein